MVKEFLRLVKKFKCWKFILDTNKCILNQAILKIVDFSLMYCKVYRLNLKVEQFIAFLGTYT